MNKLTSILFATLITGAGSLAYAHGDEAHAQKAGPVKMEQTPWGIAGDAKVFTDKLDGKVANLEVIPIDKLDLDSPSLRKGKPEPQMLTP